jgi:hypothetical protein
MLYEIVYLTQLAPELTVEALASERFVQAAIAVLV